MSAATVQDRPKRQEKARRRRVAKGQRRKARRYQKLEKARQRVLGRLRLELRELRKGGSFPAVDWELVERVDNSVRGCYVTPFMCCNGHVAVSADRCEKRGCPVCDARSSDELVATYQAAVEQMKDPRLLTLTCGRCPFGKLAYWLKEFVRSWQKLRNRVPPGLRLEAKGGNSRGGIWRLEIVPKADGFHVHMHALVDGWVENRNEKGRPLETAWAAVTSWSSDKARRSVRMDRIPTGDSEADTARRNGAVREAFKYAVKGAVADVEEETETWAEEDELGLSVQGDAPALLDLENRKGDPAEWSEGYPALAEILTAIAGRKLGDCWGEVREDVKAAEAEEEERREREKEEGRDLEEWEAELVPPPEGEHGWRCSKCGERMLCCTWGHVEVGSAPPKGLRGGTKEAYWWRSSPP